MAKASRLRTRKTQPKRFERGRRCAISRKNSGVCPFFLERIGIVRAADDLDLVGHDFPALAFALRRHQLAAHDDRSAGDQMLNLRIIRQRAPGR